MKGLKGLLIFLLGVGAGAAGAYYYLNDKFNKELDKEVEKVKNYKNNVDIYEGSDFTEVEEPEKPVEPDIHITAPEKPALFDYAKISSQKHKETSAKSEQKMDTSKMHLVTADRFEELSYEYETQDLIYYSDGIITDVSDEIMFNSLDELVPSATEEDFDSDGYLYVADDAISRVYEISLDTRTYADVFGTED